MCVYGVKQIKTMGFRYPWFLLVIVIPSIADFSTNFFAKICRLIIGCTKIKTLTIKSSKLTTKNIGSKAFTKTPKSMTVKMPKKKFKAYKSMLIKKGVNKKAKFKKN